MKIGIYLHNLAEGVLIAFDSIRANKVRASLTILGIAIGVFVVTAMSAAVHGINAGVSANLAAAGPKTFFVTKWPMAMNVCDGTPESCPWLSNAPLTINERDRLARLPNIDAVVAHLGTSAAFKYNDRELPGAGIDAYSAEWAAVDGGTIDPGRNFTAAENANASNVVIINASMKERLFGESSALDKRISINGNPFTVIGVYTPMANVFAGGNNSRAIVPIETARRRLNAGMRWMEFSVKPSAAVSQDQAIDDVIGELRTGRGLKPAQDNSFFVSTQEKVMELYNQIVGVFFLVMIVLSAIGLMVGGVGVVAIMMISVTERTREIGVRKALGATKGTILWQFLVEAATLTLIGAVIGLAVGGGLAWAIRTFSPIEASIPPLAIVAAITASAFTGILFGMLPAVRAAGLDPVEALRHE